MLALLLTVLPVLPLNVLPGIVLPGRAASWPDWHLPAPLQPSGRADLVYPSWFAGSWIVSSDDGTYPVRFALRSDGTVVGERAFNAASVGRAVLGDALLRVDNDPANPNRQLAALNNDLLLESTVVARRSEAPATGAEFLADELALQVLHQPGAPPRISRIETLSRYRLQNDGSIDGEQWQATYASPASGLAAEPLRSAHWQLTLTPDAPPGDHAS
jgi:hypothetical protein